MDRNILGMRNENKPNAIFKSWIIFIQLPFNIATNYKNLNEEKT